MALFSFSVGLVLRRGEQMLEFRRHLQNGQLQFEDQLSGQIYTWSVQKIYREINSGELCIFRGDPVQRGGDDKDDKRGKQIPLISSIESLPEKYLHDLERKQDYIRTCRKQGITRGDRKKIQAMLNKIAQRRNECAPSASTVMSWWRALDQSDQNPGAIVSGYHDRRRRRLLHEKVIELIQKVARKEYFTRDRYPLSRTHLLVSRALKTPISDAGEIVSPRQVSLSTVRRIVNEVSPYFQDVARYGSAYARNKWRYSLNGVVTSRVLERVEVDHTLLDIVVICDRSGLPLGRPTITVVIDAHSGYILAFFVSFWGTGLGPTLSALKIAITPKYEYYEGTTELSNPWLGYGIPELFVVDNGLEFHSPQFRLAAWHLNADVQYCAVRQPWLKPSVERVLGELGLYLPAQGRVHKPLNNYLPPNPRETASITFSQLCTGLLKCFVDVLPMEPSNQTLVEPFELFREGFERLPPPLLPSSFSELDLIGAMSKQLTVGNEGIVSEYLRYNCRELQELRRSISPRFKTLIKFHPEDLDFIYVQDPQSKKWLLVPSCQPEYTGQLSLVQHRAIRHHLKGQLQSRNVLEKLMRGKLELIDLWADFLRGHRGKKNIQAAQKFGTLTSAQSLVGRVSDMKAPVPEPSLVREDDFRSPSREIPKFSSFQLD